MGLRTEQRPAQRPPRELGVLILDGILELCPGRGGIRCYNDWLVTMVLHVLHAGAHPVQQTAVPCPVQL